MKIRPAATRTIQNPTRRALFRSAFRRRCLAFFKIASWFNLRLSASVQFRPLAKRERTRTDGLLRVGERDDQSHDLSVNTTRVASRVTVGGLTGPDRAPAFPSVRSPDVEVALAVELQSLINRA